MTFFMKMVAQGLTRKERLLQLSVEAPQEKSVFYASSVESVEFEGQEKHSYELKTPVAVRFIEWVGDGEKTLGTFFEENAPFNSLQTKFLGDQLKLKGIAAFEVLCGVCKDHNPAVLNAFQQSTEAHPTVLLCNAALIAVQVMTEEGAEAYLKVLVSHGADLTERSHPGASTLLISAAGLGQRGVVLYLLEHFSTTLKDEEVASYLSAKDPVFNSNFLQHYAASGKITPAQVQEVVSLLSGSIHNPKEVTSILENTNRDGHNFLSLLVNMSHNPAAVKATKPYQEMAELMGIPLMKSPAARSRKSVDGGDQLYSPHRLGSGGRGGSSAFKLPPESPGSRDKRKSEGDGRSDFGSPASDKFTRTPSGKVPTRDSGVSLVSSDGLATGDPRSQIVFAPSLSTSVTFHSHLLPSVNHETASVDLMKVALDDPRIRQGAFEVVWMVEHGATAPVPYLVVRPNLQDS